MTFSGSKATIDLSANGPETKGNKMAEYTVIHTNNTTGREHVEEAGKGEVWTADYDTAHVLSGAYRANGFPAYVQDAAGLAVENLPFDGSLVLQ